MPTKTFTVGKDATMGKDTGSGFSGWNGFDNHLQIGSNGDRKYRVALRFGINFSSMNEITSATLKLVSRGTDPDHQHQTEASSAVTIGRCTRSWGEGNINPGEGDLTGRLDWHWDNRFDKFTGEKTITGVVQGAQDNVVELDVTEIVEAWRSGRPNRGFLIKNASSESDDGYALLFYSGDQSDPDRKPKLEIVYDGNTAPDAPINLSPTGDEVVNTLVPVFNFTTDDSDPDDYITARNVEVYADEVTVPSSATTAQKIWTAIAVPVPGAPINLSVLYGDALVNKTFSPLVPGTFYKWRVQVADRAGLWSPWTTLQRFKVQIPPSPPNLCLLPTPHTAIPTQVPTVTVSHNSPILTNSDMYGYTVTVEQESSPCAGDWEVIWTTGDVDTSGSPEPSVLVNIASLDLGGSFRIRARTKDVDGNWSSYSAWLKFKVHKALPPINLSPSNGESVAAAFSFAGDQAHPNDVITSFWIRVYNEDLSLMLLGSTQYTDDIKGGVTFDVAYAGGTLTAGSTYYWQVKVETENGDVSEWSALQGFSVVAATVPSISAPHAENNWSITPTIEASRASSFNRIQYEVYPDTSTSDNLGTVHYASGTLSSDIGAGGLGTEYSAAYAGTALLYGTGYKIRARVSSDAGASWSDWSGLTWFKTGMAGTPVLTSVDGESSDLAIIGDDTPDFLITRTDSDTIDEAQVLVYNDLGTILIWDSGMVDVADATTATITYAGDPLVLGTTYAWTARYTNTSGRVGAYAAKKQFRLNGPPNVPSLLVPANAHVFADTDNWIFEAFYSDPDHPCFIDNPTEWEIEVQEIDETPFDIEVITSDLVGGLNRAQWPGSAFITDDEYRWRTRFKDGTSYGPYSAWQSFKVASPPNGTITLPTNGSTVSSVTPTIQWSYSGGTQWRYTLEIDRTNEDGVKVQDVAVLGPFYGTETSKALTAGYLLDNNYYDITLTVWSTDGLADPTPSTVNVLVELDAPDPITGFHGTDYECSARIYLEWDAMTLKVGHNFICYRVYRKRTYEQDWTNIGEVESMSTPYFDDWYAGIGVLYEYKVVAVTTKSGVGVEMESPDDPDFGSYDILDIDADSWVFIGADRSPTHMMCIAVTDEGHNRPIQQEVFETLGANRKTIMRGFVLGHEGSITTIWQNIEVESPEDHQVLINETALGRRLVDYLTFNAGPHILKSPFGDVWEAQFLSPTYTWMPVGHLEVVLEYIETGQTSQEEG